MNFLSLYFAKIVVKTFPKETGFITKNGSGIPILELTQYLNFLTVPLDWINHAILHFNQSFFCSGFF
ncbi:MAG: hypothetical protein AMJ73_03985 [candidate division Zixibacteria bacterium SM1_73]|nr:MAG: hypothetical protein AMJ73_03985 [candidate division Zixibacteria bacterium SM1_73]